MNAEKSCNIMTNVAGELDSKIPRLKFLYLCLLNFIYSDVYVFFEFSLYNT